MPTAGLNASPSSRYDTCPENGKFGYDRRAPRAVRFQSVVSSSNLFLSCHTKNAWNCRFLFPRNVDVPASKSTPTVWRTGISDSLSVARRVYTRPIVLSDQIFCFHLATAKSSVLKLFPPVL